jgi:hypothetical protein
MPDPVVSNAASAAAASTVANPGQESATPLPADAISLSQMFSQDAAAGATAATAPQTQSTSVAPVAGLPAVTTPAAATHSQPSAFAQQAAEVGIELPATATDAEVFAAMSGRLKQFAPLAQYAQALLPHADQINEFFASRGGPQTSTTTPEAAGDGWSVEKHFQKQWDAPKLTPQMQYAMNAGLVVRDPETGVMNAKPGFEVMVAPLLNELNHAINWERDAVRDFFQANPLKKTYDALEEPLKRLIQAEVEQRLQETRLQEMAVSGIKQFDQQHEKWLYQPSANGGQMMTQKGQQFVELVKLLKGNWTGDATTLLNLCRLAVTNAPVGDPVGDPVAQTAAAAAMINDKKQQSFLTNALEQAAHQPSAGANTVQSPSGPVVVTQRELEDLFLNDYRAQAGAAA